MKVLAVLALVALSIASYAQEVSEDDWTTLYENLMDAKWDKVAAKSGALLHGLGREDDSVDKARLVYMYIYSNAALVSEDKLSYDSLDVRIMKYEGSHIIMPGHPVIDSGAFGYNSIQFRKEGEAWKAVTTSTNEDRTSIISFEYFTLADPIMPKDYIGKNVVCSGTLEHIAPNPNRSKIVILRLYMTGAMVNVMD